MSRRPLPPTRDVLHALLTLLALIGACLLLTLLLHGAIGSGWLARLPLTVMPFVVGGFFIYLARAR